MPSPSSRLPHELIGNLWDFHRAESNCFIVIPTNGVLKANGDAVMGAGLAKQAAQQFPTLPKLLGQAIHDTGNAVVMTRAIHALIFNYKPLNLRTFTEMKEVINCHALNRSAGKWPLSCTQLSSR